MDAFIYHNHHFYSSDTPLISPLDIAVQRGYAVCDTFRTYNKEPFLLDQHVDRFLKGIEDLRLEVPYTRQTLITIIEEMIRKLPFKAQEVVGKILMTPGTTQGSSCYYTESFYKHITPKVFIALLPFTPYPEAWYKEGVPLKTVEYIRPVPEIKHTNYTYAFKTLATGAAPGIHDVLYKAPSGELFEAGTASFFAIDQRGHLITASDQYVLKGITRKFVLNLAKEKGTTIDFSFPNLNDLPTYKAAFITSCNRGILPISQIDTIKLPHPSSCKELKQLSEAMENYIIKKYFYNKVDI